MGSRFPLPCAIACNFPFGSHRGQPQQRGHNVDRVNLHLDLSPVTARRYEKCHWLSLYWGELSGTRMGPGLFLEGSAAYLDSTEV
jgi:hypothetical protein